MGENSLIPGWRGFGLAFLAVVLIVACGQERKQQTDAEYVKALDQKPVPSEMRPVDYVNPLIGTKREHGRGRTFPWAGIPFGMTKWTPQTQNSEPLYRYEHSAIQGFRGTHYPGSFRSDYGAVTVMPLTGKLQTLPDHRGSSFSHEQEITTPGYYRVKLPDYNIVVEMTATHTTGFLRCIFPETQEAHFVIDALEKGGFTKILPEANEVIGYNSGGSWRSPDAKIVGYFVAQFNKAFSGYGTWSGHELFPNQPEVQGEHPGGYVDFSTSANDTLLVKIGTSFISTEQARENISQEIPGWNFDQIVRKIRENWDDELRVIEVEGGTEDQKSIFYTALWNALRLPRNMAEHGKYWSVFDEKVHDISGRGWYGSGEAFWDTFRAKHPLLGLIRPQVENDFIRTLLDMYDQAGWIPKRPNPGFSNGMIGTHADAIIAAAYMRGIRNFDAEKAYEAMMKNAMEKGPDFYEARKGIEYYKELGYVPADKMGYYRNRLGGQATARTLEFAYDDYSIARMAEALGKHEDHQTFIKRAKYYQNVYDPGVDFVRGRNADGSWTHVPFDPLAKAGPFTESTPWQYTWHVQQDMRGLVNLMGREQFVQRLETALEKGRETGPDFVAEPMNGTSGNLYYWHGNEPVHHAVFGFLYAGEPWKTQYWVREIMHLGYLNEPKGLPGDEDQGQMSAWYVWNAMGLYTTNPAQATYDIGSPIFDKVTIHLNEKYHSGDTFVIRAKGTSHDSRYIQSATLNGKPLEKTWITHEDIITGGELSFQMGPAPNKKWGADEEAAPPSITTTDPSITYESLALQKTRVVAGENLVAGVTLRNTGGIGAFRIELLVNGEVIKRKWVIVDDNRHTEFPVVISLDEPGQYEISVADLAPEVVTVEE